MKKHCLEMIQTQIKPRGISDQRVLSALAKVPRHEFAPGYTLDEAYSDSPLPIGHGQTISQPYIVALMTQLCGLTGQEKVLEIGTGSGYQTAVLALLSHTIFTIERITALGLTAQLRLNSFTNINFIIGDGYEGLPASAPFDVIILTASPPEIPAALLNQLKQDGRLIAPAGDTVQKLVKITRSGSVFTEEVITFVRFVPMLKGVE